MDCAKPTKPTFPEPDFSFYVQTRATRATGAASHTGREETDTLNKHASISSVDSLNPSYLNGREWTCYCVIRGNMKMSCGGENGKKNKQGSQTSAPGFTLCGLRNG